MGKIKTLFHLICETNCAGWRGSLLNMLCVASLSLMMLGLGRAPANAGEISGDFDYFLTPDDIHTNVELFGTHYQLCSLPTYQPGDLACRLWGEPGRRPTATHFVTHWVDQHGNVVGPDSQHKVHQVVIEYPPYPLPFDTVIHRGDVIIGASDTQKTASLQFDWLSLRTNPEGVTIAGQSGLFDIYVGLNSHVTQSIGKMNLIFDTPGDTHSGRLDLGTLTNVDDQDRLKITDPDSQNYGLIVDYEYRVFRHLDDPLTATALAVGTDVSIFHNQTGTFSVVPEPSSMVLLSLGTVAALLPPIWRSRPFARRRAN